MSDNIAVPEAAQLEIKRLHLDLVAKAKTFEAARLVFNTFIRSTMHILHVPLDSKWVLAEDASHFKETT
jgi:hypothetical protein